MAITLKVFSNESIEAFSNDFCSDEKLETGSLNAAACALASSLFERAALMAPKSDRQEYILRNAEILRKYFIHLIDDDIKARAGYIKESNEGNIDNAEAARHPACSINEEIISMSTQMLELGLELKDLLDIKYHHYLKEMADITLGAIKSSIDWLLDFTSYSIDDTYKYVVKRENELNLEYIESLYGKY